MRTVLTKDKRLSLSLWKEARHAAETSSGLSVSSRLAAVCSPAYTRVWAISKVTFKLMFGNIDQGGEYSQLVEDRFC